MKLKSRIRKIIAVPTFDNDIKNRQAKNIYLISMLLIFIFTFALIILTIIIGVDYFIITIISVLNVYLTIALIFVKKGYLKISGFLVPFSLLSLISIASFSRGGLDSGVMFLNIIPILLVGLLLGLTWSIIFAVIVILLASVLLIVTRYSLYEFPLEPLIQTEVKYILLVILIITVILFPYLTSKSKSLTATQQIKLEFESIVTSIKNAVVSINKNLEITLHNSASQKLFTEKVKMSFLNKITPIIENLYFSSQENSDFDLKLNNIIQFPGDSNDFFQASLFLIETTNTKNNHVLCIIENITDEHEIENIKTEFITTVAHELRTPLTSILGFSEILLNRKNISYDERIKFLQYIRNKSSIMKNLINDLLDISNLESGVDTQLNKELCVLGDGIIEILSPFVDRYPDFKFHIDLLDSEIQAIIDKEGLKRVLDNLLDNAIKYSTDKKNVWITSEIVNDFYIVNIRDDGIGVTEEQISKLFTKFYRGDRTNTAIEGTGLGLAICKNIIELHGGTIYVKSEVGRGSKFSFSIPIDN